MAKVSKIKRPATKSKGGSRWPYWLGALAIGAMFCGALYLQYVKHQEPCPLCMVQRGIFAVMGVLFLIAALHNPRATAAKIYGFLIGLLAFVGVGVAARHIWIQHLPKDQVPACGPGLDYMLKNFPMSDVLRELMHGSGECAEKGWTLLNLGIPEWSLVSYVLLGCWAMLVAVKRS
ncbi:MAG: disulfide bond formation protein B [Nitrosomonadales bacterium]|nr:disulfide bond formation protein B [Nitrosomonadales bacterium]